MSWNVYCTNYDGHAYNDDFASKEEAAQAIKKDKLGSGYFPVKSLPWRPISELSDEDKYGDEAGFLIMAPELVDLDCNVHGVGMGYWQDDGLLWDLSQAEVLQASPERDHGSWMACKWSMTNDEWSHVCCTPTHYLRLRGLA